MRHDYPAAPLSWAVEVARLTTAEISYGIKNGFLSTLNDDDLQARADSGLLAPEESELSKMNDIFFRILLINLQTLVLL